ncbi:MAG: mechanosensitive ion channel family protein [Cyclobacteriaceae bacterium]
MKPSQRYRSQQKGRKLSNRLSSRKRLKSRNRKLRRKQSRRRDTAEGANRQLNRFRQASIIALAFTMLLLLIFPEEEIQAQDTDTISEQAVQEEDTLTDASVEEIGQAATDEALTTLQELWQGFYNNLPKLLIAIVALFIAWLLLKMIRPLLRRFTRSWGSSNAIMAVVSISVWLLAAGVALSVLAGDIRALVGSVGLVGLALSWALQTPIESFTGWLLNSFKGYYSVGDRIAVGEVFGDVYKIDPLNTTVWEIGSPERGGAVQAEQPTGRLLTFPNNEILTGTVTNLTRDFPYVWDELAVPIANESDLPLALQVLEQLSRRLLSESMRQPADKYATILKKSNLDDKLSREPELYVSATDSWIEISIRYLVDARSRRVWKSRLQQEIVAELNKADYQGKIIPVYPRQQYQVIDDVGVPLKKRKDEGLED